MCVLVVFKYMCVGYLLVSLQTSSCPSISPSCSVTYMDSINRLQLGLANGQHLWEIKGREESEAGEFIPYLKRAYFVLHHKSEFLSRNPLHTTLSRYRFLEALPTLIPSGIEMIPCFPITSLRGLDFMIYLYPACIFKNSPTITLSSKFLIWLHHLFLARL